MEQYSSIKCGTKNNLQVKINLNKILSFTMVMILHYVGKTIFVLRDRKRQKNVNRLQDCIIFYPNNYSFNSFFSDIVNTILRLDKLLYIIIILYF